MHSQDAAVGKMPQGESCSYEDRFDELMKQVVDRRGQDLDSKDEGGSLFSSNITHELTPNNFKMPTIDPYDGTMDLRVDLMKYVQHMGVARVTEEVMCRCFRTFLTRLATMWFYRLDNGLISS